MKINFINLSNMVGGQEIYLYNILQRLQNKYDIRLFVHQLNFDLKLTKDLKKVEIVNLPSIEYSQFIKIKQIIKKETQKDDIFIFNGNRAIYLGALFSKDYTKICIQHSSMVDVQEGILKKNLRVLLYKALLINYKELIGVSLNTVKPIANSSKVSVIYNGIDTSKFSPVSIEDKILLRRELGFKEDDKILIMVGALTENKGQLDALKIIEKLGDDYKLIIVGDGPDRGRIQDYIEQHRLQNKVILTGKITDVERYYWISDALLFLSKNEGLPLTILEAMATGLPVFTTEVGGIPEVINNYENGIFIERNNVEQTALIIEHTLQDQSLLEKFKENNIEKINNNFTLDKNVELLERRILFHQMNS
jgi:glycosyltransferase involved in cell wall biosynthesis